MTKNKKEERSWSKIFLLFIFFGLSCFVFLMPHIMLTHFLILYDLLTKSQISLTILHILTYKIQTYYIILADYFTKTTLSTLLPKYFHFPTTNQSGIFSFKSSEKKHYFVEKYNSYFLFYYLFHLHSTYCRLIQIYKIPP